MHPQAPAATAAAHRLRGVAALAIRRRLVLPRETFSLDETGLATLIDGERPPLTTDHETYSDTAMAAAMQDVQLPAIATVTNPGERPVAQTADQ